MKGDNKITQEEANNFAESFGEAQERNANQVQQSKEDSYPKHYDKGSSCGGSNNKTPTNS